MNLLAHLWNKFGLKEGDDIEPSRRNFLRMAMLSVPAVVVGEKLGIIEGLVECTSKIFVPEVPTISVVNAFALQLEAVRPHLTSLFEVDSSLYSLLAGIPYYVDPDIGSRYLGLERSVYSGRISK